MKNNFRILKEVKLFKFMLSTREGVALTYVVYFDLRPRSKWKSKVNLKYSSRSTVKPPYLFEVFGQIGQGQSKILAKMSAIIGSMQCSNKIFGQDFDRGRRSEYTAYASATPLTSRDTSTYTCNILKVHTQLNVNFTFQGQVYGPTIP